MNTRLVILLSTLVAAEGHGELERLDLFKGGKLRQREDLAGAQGVEPGVAGYSDLAVGKDGSIYCLFEHGTTKVENRSRTAALTLATFTIDWLADGQDDGK